MNNPLRNILPAARSRIERVSRRDVLIMGASAVAMKTADVALDKLVVDPMLDRRLVDSYRATPLAFERLTTHGSPIQQAAFLAWKAGKPLPWYAEARSTMTYKGPDGEQWIDWQGDEASLLLWGRAHPRRIPMRKQPDPAFGAWSEKRLSAARGTAPQIVRVSGSIERATGGVVEHSYSVLMMPYGEDRVLTTSASWPGTPAGSPRRDPTTHIPASAGRGRDRAASI